MINLTLNDNTQKSIIPHLQTTEHLLIKTISRLTGKDCNANIYAMPDLGMPFNLTRIQGGFFTGMFAEWYCETPFIPVDATINICGVSIYEIPEEIQFEEFKARISSAVEETVKRDYNWNYADGNHFIIIGRSEKGRQYLIIHGSAKEYKESKSTQCLYPLKGSWFYNEIKTEYSLDSRYLRYIANDTAVKFYNIVQTLFQINEDRNDYFAELILRGVSGNKVFYKEHYGMPSQQTISIGCQWDKDQAILLTAPGKPIYLYKPKEGGKNDISIIGNKYILFPHGLGMKAKNELIIEYTNDSMRINEEVFFNKASLKDNSQFEIRAHFDSRDDFSKIITETLSICNAELIEEIIPLFSYSKFGYEMFE